MEQAGLTEASVRPKMGHWVGSFTPFQAVWGDFPTTRQSQSGVFYPAVPLYAVTSCAHGGTRNNINSSIDHTWSVIPAAIVGVRGCHFLGEPVPFVGMGCGRGSRSDECGRQKL